MKKTVRRSIEVSFLGFIFLLSSLSVLAQPTVIEPGNSSVNPALLNTGKFTWGTGGGLFRGPKIDEMRLVSVQRNNQEITIETRDSKKGLETSKKTLVLNAKTLDPIRQSYTGEEVSYDLQYGTSVKGTRTIFDTNKKENLNEAVAGKYFDIDSLPFVISSLPLSVDYRVSLPVIRFTGSFKPEYLRYRITDVSEERRFSCLSGYRDLWKVTVFENTQTLELTLYIDKATRRILGVENNHILVLTKFIYADRETDVNPIKAPFNADETAAMLTGGTSSIKGQASTKISEKRLIGNKTQYAPKGSLVSLIPNTPYFKEWINFNLIIGNISRPVYYDGKLVGGCSYPMPQEIKKHSLVTDVIDDKGNFVFQNLKPGEYLVFVGFVANKYTRTTRTPTGDYSINVGSDGSAYANQIIDVKNWMSPQNVVNHQFVKVNKEGETVSVKLKD